MEQLVPSIHIFPSALEDGNAIFEKRLSQGFSPEALVITCSDSPSMPNSLNEYLQKGELLVSQMLGNVVPAWHETSSTHATLEFAILHHKVKHVIVCGHFGCSVAKPGFGIANKPMSTAAESALKTVESLFGITSNTLKNFYSGLTDGTLQEVFVQENVLTQLENLLSCPYILKMVQDGVLKLHGWVLCQEPEELFTYNYELKQFVPFTLPELFSPSGKKIIPMPKKYST